MWHRLQVLISKEQLQWLRLQAFRTGSSIGKIVRDLINKAMENSKDEN
jgi:hypothetical protein